MTPQGAVRFEAQWVTKQYVDENGEGDPDKDRYASSYHLTRETAEAAALTASKRVAECEWFLVAEQKYIGYQWVDQRRWTGDWGGLVEETMNLEDAEGGAA